MVGLQVVDDPLFDEHRARGYHPERPERLLAARHATETCVSRGVPRHRLPPRDATPDEIARIHSAAYVDILERAEGLFEALDDDTYLSPRSVPAALRAAGGAVALIDAILDGTNEAPQLGVALLRPPGHHARPERGMGFCLLNNVAIAAAHARSRGIERVAIVDWDVHHGNGTQDAFYRDPNVLFISLHQYPFYPGTGAATEVGEGDGKGFNVNIPLSANGTDAIYRMAFERIVAPVLEQYAPQLVLVSAGFDAHARDPLAGMTLTADGFRSMAGVVQKAAARSASSRVGVFLEGGYDLEGLESSLLATLETLTALPHEDAAVPGDAAHSAPQSAPQSARPQSAPASQRHNLEIERACRTLAPYWKL